MIIKKLSTFVFLLAMLTNIKISSMQEDDSLSIKEEEMFIIESLSSDMSLIFFLLYGDIDKNRYANKANIVKPTKALKKFLKSLTKTKEKFNRLKNELQQSLEIQNEEKFNEAPEENSEIPIDPFYFKPKNCH